MTTNGQLKALVDRIERVNGEIKDLQDDVKEIYKEAASSGYSAKHLRKFISLRRKKESVLKEEAEMLQMFQNDTGYQLPLMLG